MKKKSILSQLTKHISILKDSKIDSAEIDAEIILQFVTGKSREFLLAHPEYELSVDELKLYQICVDRRKSDKPVAYITGKKEFFGLDFFVTPDVLIPRPETEILVEEGLKFLEYRTENRKLRILDVGTGSGSIIISIVKAFSCQLLTVSCFATDISAKALKIAKKNAKFHQVEDKIKFVKSDLFSNKKLPKKFDLIVANLPYVPKEKNGKLLVDSRRSLPRATTRGGNDGTKTKNQQLTTNNLRYEPQDAIFADDNGTKVIKKFLDQTVKRINAGGIILIEVDPRNAKELTNYAKKYFKKVELKKDLASRNRIIIISK